MDETGYITRANTFDQDEGRYGLGFGGGLLAVLAGAALWGVAAAMVRNEAGWMAMVVGLIVGFCVRFCGRGSHSFFSMTGATMTVAGCAAGRVLAISILAAHDGHQPLMAYLRDVNLTRAGLMLRSHVGTQDLVFVGMAALIAYGLSVRKPKESA